VADQCVLRCRRPSQRQRVREHGREDGPRPNEENKIDEDKPADLFSSAVLTRRSSPILFASRWVLLFLLVGDTVTVANDNMTRLLEDR